MQERQEIEFNDDEESQKTCTYLVSEDSDLIEGDFNGEKQIGGASSFPQVLRTKIIAAVIVSMVLAVTSVAIGVGLQARSSPYQNQASHGGSATDGNSTVTTNYNTSHNSSDPTISPPQAATFAPSLAPPGSTEAPTTRDPSYDPSSEAPTACVSDTNSSTPEPLAGKRGAAFAVSEGSSYAEKLPRLLQLEPYWFYSWSPSIPDPVRQATAGVEFVPMVWGAVSSGDLESTLDQLLNDTRVKRLLGFNEPDKASQANMNVTAAVMYWERLESLMPHHVSLVSPACSDPDGEWMQDFMSQSSGRKTQSRQQQGRCGDENDAYGTIDHVAVHWYGPPDVETFQSAMQMYYGLYNRSLMVTEFAVADWTAETVQDNRYSREDVLEFMKAALPWLESQSWVAAYSWFPYEMTDPVGTSSALFDRNGNLTRLGAYYKSVGNENPSGNQSISVWKN
jgi:hypothetical protein